MNHEISCTYKASRLYHLKAIGIGTPYIESLASYIKRLAEAHSVSLGNLLDKEIIPCTNRIYLKNHHYIGKNSKNINSMSSNISEDIVRILEEKTSNSNLKYLTLSAWKACFSANNLLRKKQAWCPICYEESLRMRQPIYEQLIWCLNDIEICGKHQVRLVTECPYCNNEFYIFSNLARVGYCNNCKAWLGLKKYENSQISRENIEWNNWVYNNIGQLIIVVPTIKGISNLSFSKNIINIMESHNLSQKCFSDELNVSSETIRYWLCGGKPILSHVLGLSFKLGYSVHDILTKELNTRNMVFHSDRVILKKKRNKKIDMNELKKAFDEAISSNNGVSLCKLSIRFGIKISTIKKYFPKEATKLKTSYNEYVEKRKLDRLMLIKDTMKLLMQMGIFPSRKALSRQLGKRTVTNDEERRVWFETLEELGFTSEDYKNNLGSRK